MRSLKYQAAALLCAAVIGIALAADSGGFIRLQPEQVPFKNGPGVEQVVLFGDPSRSGIYVIRVRFPPGMHSNPHYHSQDRHVTVIKGTWLMGVGNQANVATAVPLKAGAYALHPAHDVHWDGAGNEETIVQIIGMGPVETVQVDPGASPMGQWSLPVDK
jgi:quercetin dioxygenase-like cupin family protein